MGIGPFVVAFEHGNGGFLFQAQAVNGRCKSIFQVFNAAVYLFFHFDAGRGNHQRHMFGFSAIVDFGPGKNFDLFQAVITPYGYARRQHSLFFEPVDDALLGRIDKTVVYIGITVAEAFEQAAGFFGQFAERGRKFTFQINMDFQSAVHPVQYMQSRRRKRVAFIAGHIRIAQNGKQV